MMVWICNTLTCIHMNIIYAYTHLNRIVLNMWSESDV